MIFCSLDDRVFYFPSNYNNPDCMGNKGTPFKLYKTVRYITLECVITRPDLTFAELLDRQEA